MLKINMYHKNDLTLYHAVLTFTEEKISQIVDIEQCIENLRLGDRYTLLLSMGGSKFNLQIISWFDKLIFFLDSEEVLNRKMQYLKQTL